MFGGQVSSRFRGEVLKEKLNMVEHEIDNVNAHPVQQLLHLDKLQQPPFWATLPSRMRDKLDGQAIYTLYGVDIVCIKTIRQFLDPCCDLGGIMAIMDLDQLTSQHHSLCRIGRVLTRVSEKTYPSNKNACNVSDAI